MHSVKYDCGLLDFMKMADAVGALATLESSAVFGSAVCPSPSPSAGCTEGFDLLDDSGSEVATPDMESQVLFVKLKEVCASEVVRAVSNRR